MRELASNTMVSSCTSRTNPLPGMIVLFTRWYSTGALSMAGK